MVSDEYLNIPTIARMLVVSEWHARQRMMDEGIEPVTFGGRAQFFRRDEVEQLLPDETPKRQRRRRTAAAA